MQIGQLAKQAQVPIDTIRYYESHDILPAPARSGSGYRTYSEDDVARLRFVRRAKALGFTLREISELLQISSGEDMAAMRTAAAARLAGVERKLDELTRIRDGLRALVVACPGHGHVQTCPILAALSKEDA